MNEKVYPKDE